MVNRQATPFGDCIVIQSRMADDALIRRQNLEKLFPRKTWGPKAMSAKFGNSRSFWSDLRLGRKSFGEKLARDIEDQAGLPRGSLDDVEGDVQMPLLSIELTERLAKLSADQRTQAENLLRVHLGLEPLQSSGNGTGTDG